MPSIKIKLVLAQAANLVHQGDRDVTMLSGWSMLFGGIGIGAFLVGRRSTWRVCSRSNSGYSWQ